MPIEYRWSNNLWRPFFICDVCSEEIKNYGNIEYKVSGPTKDVKGKPFYVHKVNENGKQCDRFLREKLFPCNENEDWYWEELDIFCLQLFTNLVDPEDKNPDLLNFCLKFLQLRLSDFIDINSQELNRAGVYLLFDKKELVYVGESKNIQTRLKINHHVYNDFYKIRKIDIREEPKRKEVERILISFLHPPLNSVYNKSV